MKIKINKEWGNSHSFFFFRLIIFNIYSFIYHISVTY
nr:MAG TPA: hypothetical protein [Caudoviricetes sp.]